MRSKQLHITDKYDIPSSSTLWSLSLLWYANYKRDETNYTPEKELYLPVTRGSHYADEVIWTVIKHYIRFYLMGALLVATNYIKNK